MHPRQASPWIARTFRRPAPAPDAARYLDDLESEAIFILREAAAEFANPALLFSGGKDSTVLLRLAEKAFRPAKLPFPLLHVDTGHNFPEVIAFRDRIVAHLGERLIVRHVQDSIDRGRVRLKSADQSRNALQTVTLLDAIAEFEFDALHRRRAARRRESRAPKSASSRSAIPSASGTRAISGRNCGASITGGSTAASRCASFP